MANELTDIRLVIEVVANASPLDKVAASMTKVNAASMKGQQIQSSAAKTVNTATGKWIRFSEKLKAAERDMDAVFRAGVHLQAMGRDLTGAGMSLVNWAQNVVKEYAKYDFILRQTSVALNTNEEWTRKLDKAIQGTAITLGKFKPEEVAEAYRLWGAATGEVVDDQETLARITKTVSDILVATAMAGGTVESNIKGIYGVLKQYNMRMGDAAHVTQVLAVLTERTAADFGDLTGAFVYTGSAIGNIGGTFDDTAQVLGILADAGFRGTKAGRGLSMVFEAFLSPATEKAKKALDGLAKKASGGKKSWEDLITPIKNGKRHFIGIRETVEQLATAMKNMGPVERQQAINAIFTNNAARAMLPTINAQINLWREQAKAGKELTSVFDEQKYSLAEAAGFFENMKGQFLGSMDAIIGSFRNSFFPLIQMMAVEIMKFAGPVMKYVQKQLERFTKFLEKNPALVKFAVKIGAAAAAILILVGGFITLLGTMALFGSSIFLIGAALLPVVAIVIAVGAALAGLAYLIYSNAGGIRDALMNLGAALARIWKIIVGDGSGVTSFVQSVVDVLKKLGDIALNAVVDAINWLADALNSLTPEQIDIIKKIVLALLGVVAVTKGIGLATAAINGLSSGLMAMTMALETIKKVHMAMVGLPGVITGLVGALRGLGAAFAMLNIAIGPIGWAILAIVAAIAAFVIAYETNFLGFRDFVDGLVKWFMDNVIPVIEQVISFLGPIIEWLVGAIGDFITTAIGIIQGLIDFFANLPANISAFINEVVTNIQNFINTIVTTVTTFLQNLANNWAYYLGFILGFIIGTIAKIILNIIQFGIDFLKNVISFLSKLPGAFADFFGRVLGTLANWFATTIPKVAAWAGQTIGAIVDWFVQLPGKIANAFANVLTAIANWFITNIPIIGQKALALITEIVKFFLELPGKAVEAIKNLPTTLANFFKSIVAAGSKIINAVIGVGKAIVEGVWKGIQDMVGWFTKQVENFFSGIVDGVKQGLGIQSPSKVFAEIGANIVAGVAVGIDKNAAAAEAMQRMTDDLTSMATKASTDIGLGGTTRMTSTSTSDATKSIELNVNVESADGSVSQIELNTLADLITGSSMVRALERMGATD